MVRRRRFVSCAICAAVTLAATRDNSAAQAQPGFTRTVLRKIEYPDDKYVCVLVAIDIEPNALIARHTHPGVESGYLVAGISTLSIQGQPDRILKVGDGYQIPPETPHSVRNGSEKSQVVATFIVDKSKPLASLAPE